METQTHQTSPIAMAMRSTWAIDPAHSHVQFAVRHLVVSTVKGRFGSVSGTITLDEQHLASSSVDVEIDAATVDTREERRDAHLRSADFLDVERFPTISFRGTRVEPGRGAAFRTRRHPRAVRARAPSGWCGMPRAPPRSSRSR